MRVRRIPVTPTVPLTISLLILIICNLACSSQAKPVITPTLSTFLITTPVPTSTNKTVLTLTPLPTATLRPTATPTPVLTPTREPWVAPGQRYYFPVQPPTVARYSNEHHDYPAADIFVPIGSIVVAIADGIVDEVSRVDRWDPRTNDCAYRGGLWVSIVGSDGVRYYTSHLGSVETGIETGVHVHAGQIIGRSSHTGNATPTPPHVHFGISHPTFPGDWAIRRGQVWPYKYLQAWTHGENLKPVLP